MITPGKLVWWVVIALLGLGVVMVNSAGVSVASDEPLTVASLMTGRPMIYAALAVLAMLLTSRWRLDRLNARGPANPVVILVGLAIVLLLLVLVPGVGIEINGSRRWLFIPPRSLNLTFQPSEIAKWVMVVALAWWCARHAGAMRRFGSGLLPPAVLLGIVCGLIIMEDLGTAVLIGAVGGLLLLAGGTKWWQLAAPLPVAIGGVAAMIATSEYRVRRLVAFVDPFADPGGVGYHPIQSMVAIAGGATPRGLGNGIQKLGYLPADTTDFLFAVICEELGIAGAALVIGLYLVLLWAAVAIIRECRHTFGRLLGLGVVLTISLQALMNIAVVTVVVPTKGIALPLLSYGGTGWVLTAAALGLLVAIERDSRRQVADQPKSAPIRRRVLSISASEAAPLAPHAA